jgi:hypothetical protein
MILCILASQVARITGVRNQCLAILTSDYTPLLIKKFTVEQCANTGSSLIHLMFTLSLDGFKRPHVIDLQCSGLCKLLYNVHKAVLRTHYYQYHSH